MLSRFSLFVTFSVSCQLAVIVSSERNDTEDSRSLVDIKYNDADIIPLDYSFIELGDLVANGFNKFVNDKTAFVKLPIVTKDEVSYGKYSFYYFILGRDAKFRKLVEESITEWRQHTCIDFRGDEIGSEKFAVFAIEEEKGCYVRTTYEESRLVGNVVLTSGCMQKQRVVQNIGQLLGLEFEMLRPDRDSYITINSDNLDKYYKQLWNLNKNKTYGIPYDYASVMHLQGRAHSKNGAITFATKDVMYQGLLARSGGTLSHRDKLLVNTRYDCLETWLKRCRIAENPCQNEGYIGASCTCVCHPGAHGNYCHFLKSKDYYEPLLPTCNQIIEQPSTIMTPNYPSTIDEGTWCVYKIKAPEHLVIKVQLSTPFHLAETKNSTCGKAFLEIRNKFETYGQVYCGNLKKNKAFISTENEISLYLDVGSDSGPQPGFMASVIFGKASDLNAAVTPKMDHLVSMAVFFLLTRQDI